MSAPRLLSNRYELGDTLGYGGMSEVHHGTDTRLGREVAVKILRADLARDPQFQERFRREAQNAAALNHPAIVAVYDTGETQTEYGPLPYIVMEYVKGRTLRDIVKTEGPLPEKRALEVMADVCAALDFSHRHGIVHRDVKPANAMITTQGAVKVMDFGIARAMHDGQAAMTQTAAVIGTAQYLSPEQARGEGVDARSDVYAAGCVVYELITGEPPFTGDSPVAVAYQHVRENPKAPSSVNPAVSPSVDAIVLKALAKGPANRYQSAAEMRSDMVRVLSGQRPSAPTVMTDEERTQVFNGGPHAAGYESSYDGDEDPKKRGRRRALTAVLLAVLGLGMVAFIAWVGGAFNEKPTSIPIPTVSGQTANEAEAALHNAGFNPVPQIVPCIGTFNNQPTCKNPDDVGKALYTDPKAGTVAATNSKVTLFVGGPPAKVQVPSLTGLSPDDAQVQLNNLKLNLDPNYTQVDVDDPNQYGKIQRQDPTANSSVDQGSTVHLTVAKTPNQVTVPNLVGQTFTSAAKTLQNLKLVPSKKDVDSDQPAGTVVGQEPNGGNVAEGKSIELDVSNGSQQKITMPDLTGMTQNGAVAQLQQLGWTGQATITYVRVSDPSQNGVVQATSPSANTQITKSQGVMLQVGASSAGSTSPSTTTTFPSRGGILPPAGGQGVGGN